MQSVSQIQELEFLGAEKTTRNSRGGMMKRIQEPEKMTDEEENLYAVADYSKPHELFIDHVLANVGNEGGLTAIDLGCGPGDILIRLRNRVDWDLWGADLSPGMLKLATEAEAQQSRTFKPINWVLSDIKNTGLPSGYFDVIFCNSVLHHLADPYKFWQEIKRISKLGTFIFVRDLRRPANEQRADEIVLQHVGNESNVVQLHYKSSLFSAYTIDEVKDQLEKTGLSGLKVEELDDRYLDISGQVAIHESDKYTGNLVCSV